jgi:hypothetical protein
MNAIRLALLCGRLRSALGRPGLPIRQRFWSRGVDHPAARAHLLEVDGRDRNHLLHLLHCPDCRQWAMGELVEGIEAASTVGSQGIPDLSAEDRQASETSYERARQLARQVGQLAGDARSQAIAAHEALSDRWAAAALIAAAGAPLEDWPQAERLAELGLEVVSLHRALSADDRRVLELGGLTALLRCRHRRGKLAEAEAAYRQALPLLSALPAVSLERAELLAAAAQLRWTGGALDEAAALFLAAAWIFGRTDQEAAQAACQLQAAFVYLDQGNPERARPNLEMPRLVLADDGLAPALAGRCACALAYCQAALGRRVRSGAMAELAAVPEDRGEQVFRLWWLARTAGCTGDHRRARRLLDAVRRQLLADGSLGEAARCTFELLLERARAGPDQPLEPLAGELVDAFGPNPAAVHAAETLGLLARLAAQQSPRFLPAAESICRELAQLPPGDGRPDLIVATQLLADPLLVYGESELIEQQRDSREEELASPEPPGAQDGALTW